jgi:hypothetical protein
MSSKIGGTAVLECDVPLPPVQAPSSKHILAWRKQGIEVPIFIQFNDYDPHIDVSYLDRVRVLQGSSIEITEIRAEDEGWYECKYTFLPEDRDGEVPPENNGTWVYLTVQCEYSP